MRATGIMQGRLVPRYNNRYQAFPKDYWKAEFHIARELGFSMIEFILDHNNAETNPLMTTEGLEEIRNVCSESGVNVRTICADYFMEAPFHFRECRAESERVLLKLIDNASKLGITDIVVPCVDNSSLKTAEDVDVFIGTIEKLLPSAEQKKVHINIESDLDPIGISALLERIRSPFFNINYDTGNSASLGYNPDEEFDAYGEYIRDLHIKDRVLGGGSVKLGTGNTDFETVFRRLKDVSFSGTVIMQAAREDEYIADLTLVKEQLRFTENFIKKYLEPSL